MAEQMPEVSSAVRENNSLVVAVEGNIGSGKSTFLDYCSRHHECAIYPEPVEKWEDFGGANVLEKFYADPAKWACPFQLLVGMTVADNYKKVSWKPIRLIERSILSSRHIFLENMARKQIIDPCMADILRTWYSRMSSEYAVQPHVIVYLRTSPAVALSRIRSRARSSEASVSLGYVQEIHDLHEEWLRGIHARNSMYDEPELPVFTIDADQQLNDLYVQYDNCLGELKFLSKH